VSRLHFLLDGSEMVRRRARVPRGRIVEAWADVEVGGGAFWVGEDSKALLDEAHGVDSEGAEWARALPADDFDRLIKRHHRA
jgi:hypothetical protein